VLKGRAWQSSVRQSEQSLLEIAALGYGAVLATAVVIVLAMSPTDSLTWIWCVGPIGAAVLAVATQARQIVWTAIGACLGIGVPALFSIGLIVLQITFCLFVWWHLSSKRDGRRVIIWSDLVWEATGFTAIVIPLFVI
jgi:hypothetical protein